MPCDFAVVPFAKFQFKLGGNEGMHVSFRQGNITQTKDGHLTCLNYPHMFTGPAEGVCFVNYNPSTEECSGELTRIMTQRECCCSLSASQGYGADRETCQPCPNSNEGRTPRSVFISSYFIY